MRTVARSKVIKFANTRELQERVLIEDLGNGEWVVPDNWRRIVEQAKTPERKIKAWQKNRRAKSADGYCEF